MGFSISNDIYDSLIIKLTNPQIPFPAGLKFLSNVNECLFHFLLLATGLWILKKSIFRLDIKEI